MDDISTLPKADQNEIGTDHETARDRFLKNRAALLGLVFVVVVSLMAIFAPLLAHYSPLTTFKDGLSSIGAPMPPSGNFWLGTDDLGRDVLSRLIYAARISLEVGLVAALVSVTVGALLGVISAFWGGWLDVLIMRITDALLAFPFLLIVILVVTIIKPSVIVIFIVIGLLGWANTARLARGQTLSIMQNSFIDASRTVGASSWYIIIRHIFPNILAPVIVFGTLQMGNYILMEGALSYMGVGVPPPTPSWGSMIFTGQQYYQTAPWLMIFPGIMITLTVVGFNLVGDGLGDALNPRG